MSPHQRENPDPYQDRRPSERQSTQGSPPSAGGGGQQGRHQQAAGHQGSHQQGGQHQGGSHQASHQQGGQHQSGSHQGGRQQGPPPEQFGGQQSAGPGGQGGQRPPSGRGGGSGQQPPQQAPPQSSPQPQQHAPQQSPPPQQSPQQPPGQFQQQSSSMGGAQQQPMPQVGTPGSVGGTGQQRPMGGPGLESASIDEILQSDVVTVESDTPITEVVEKMANEEVGSVIVVDDEEPVGVITDRSVALSLQQSPDVSERTAEEFTSSDLITGNTEMTVFEVLDQLEENGIRRLPIVDEEGSLEGIVSLDDIFVLLNAEMDQATSIIESQSPRF